MHVIWRVSDAGMSGNVETIANADQQFIQPSLENSPGTTEVPLRVIVTTLLLWS
jgi:hypothetical protein